jgi:hypothetical protein
MTPKHILAVAFALVTLLAAPAGALAQQAVFYPPGANDVTATIVAGQYGAVVGGDRIAAGRAIPRHH